MQQWHMTIVELYLDTKRFWEAVRDKGSASQIASVSSVSGVKSDTWLF